MDFHDFPRILGKSGCISHPPPQDMYRPIARDSFPAGLGQRIGHDELEGHLEKHGERVQKTLFDAIQCTRHFLILY